jgi:hypothetical protein
MAFATTLAGYWTSGVEANCGVLNVSKVEQLHKLFAAHVDIVTATEAGYETR